MNDFLRRKPLWFLVAFLVVNGVHGTDARDFHLLAANPFALHPDVDRQFLHSSPFTFFLGAPLARLVGVEAAFPLTSALGFVLLAVALARFLRRLPPERVDIAALVLLSTPLLLVFTRWIGKSDTYLAAFYLLLAAGPRFGAAALATLVVLCHREIGTIVLAVHVLHTRRATLSVLLGLAAGHLALFGYHHGLLPALPATRVGFAGDRALELGGAILANPLLHIAFALNWFWIFLVLSRDRATLVAVAAILVVAAMALDFTRVASLCALPVILQVAARAEAIPARWPFPLLFLFQLQIEAGGQVHDWSWIR